MKKNEVHFDDTFDVIVIGTGFAGLTAAIESRLAGAQVLILEKMSACGGNSIISDGGIAAPGSKLQQKFGITDSPERMYTDMLEAGMGLNDPALVHTLTENADDTFEWSQSYLGVEYLERVDIFGGHSLPRCYTAKNITGATIIKKQLAKIKELDICVRFKSQVTDFICDDNGRVCGVSIKDMKNPNSETLYIEASKGVIIASGGFASDVEFRKQYDSRLTEDIKSTNKPFATAEVLQAAIHIGAATQDLSCIQCGPWASPDESGYGVGPQFSEYIVFQYGIIIDPATGKRFINELTDRKTLSDTLFSIGHPCIGIADSWAVETAGWNIDAAINKKVVRKFETIAELASCYKINLTDLQNTIIKFNTHFDNRNDTQFNKPLLEKSAPLAKPLYYAIRLWPKVHFTMGGIKINSKSEVINTKNNIIPGLYAAGEVTGGVHGASRLGSCSITDCLVFGRIAGKNAVKQL